MLDRRTFIRIASAFSFLGALPAAVASAGRAKTVEGTVVSVNARKKRFSMTEGGYDYDYNSEPIMVITSRKTKFQLKEGDNRPKRAAFTDLEEGSSVKVTGRLSGQRLTANRVLIIVPDYDYGY